MPSVKQQIIDNWSPPILKKWATVLHSGRYGLKGDFQTWEEAQRHSTGYDSDSILESVKAALLKVKNGEAVYERDSMVFDKIEYSWPLLAGLMLVAAINNGHLNLIDFGGSLGSTYYQNRKFIKNLKSVNWNIVEQENFVKCGRKFFETPEVHFFQSVEESLKHNKSDVLLLSSVLPYIESPYQFAAHLLSFNISYIIIDRTYFTQSNVHKIAVHHVPSKLYTATIPTHILSEKQLFEVFAEKYELLEEFECNLKIESTNKDIIDKGYIFKLKDHYAQLSTL